MLAWILFFLELVILFLTSRSISQALFIIFYKIFKSEKNAVIPVFIIFMPGVIVHELSHFFMAEILLVKIHDIEIGPKINNGKLKMGSVQVSKSDIIRSMLIGVAPIIFGVTILSVGIYGFIHFIKFNQLISSPLGVLSVIFLIYLVFSITNTMFSSRKDLEGLLEFSAIIAFFILILLFVGIILNVDFILGFKNIFLSSSVTNVITLINWLLITPVIINLSFIGIAKLLFRGRI